MSQRLTFFLLLRWFGALALLSLCCVGWVPGCSSPCRTLSTKMCQQLQKEAEALCTIARSECHKPDVSARRCQALLAHWPTMGSKYTQMIRAQYQRTRASVANMTFKQGKQRLDRENHRFRKHFRKLLQFSWKLADVSQKQKHHRKPRRQRNKRRSRN